VAARRTSVTSVRVSSPETEPTSARQCHETNWLYGELVEYTGRYPEVERRGRCAKGRYKCRILRLMAHRRSLDGGIALESSKEEYPVRSLLAAGGLGNEQHRDLPGADCYSNYHRSATTPWSHYSNVKSRVDFYGGSMNSIRLPCVSITLIKRRGNLSSLKFAYEEHTLSRRNTYNIFAALIVIKIYYISFNTFLRSRY
jgi:hypothetical protein